MRDDCALYDNGIKRGVKKMKLYYHKTDGGAEYYSLTHIENSYEGDVRTWVLRTDGGEIEINTRPLVERGIRVII